MFGYGKRILLVDDNEDARNAIAVLLEEVGFSVLPADDGEHALDEMRKRHFDAVVADYEMPHMNGLHFMMDSRAEWPRTPVIIVSDKPCPRHHHLLAREAFAWIPKPIEAGTFWNVLREATKRSEQPPGLAPKRLVS